MKDAAVSRAKVRALALVSASLTALYIGAKIQFAAEGRLGVHGGPVVTPAEQARYTDAAQVSMAQWMNAGAGAMMLIVVGLPLLPATRRWRPLALLVPVALLGLVVVAAGTFMLIGSLEPGRGGHLFGSFCLVWGAVALALAWALRPHPLTQREPHDRTGQRWRQDVMDKRRPSRPIVWAAWLVPVTVLPSALWRLLQIGKEPDIWWYFVALSAGTLLAASLTVGLVRPWGERVPVKTPILGGRELPPRTVTAVAYIGAFIVMAIAAFYLYNYHFADAARPDLQLVGEPGGDLRPVRELPQAGQIAATYAPMLAWGPLLLVVATDYYRRRRDRANQ